MDTAEPLPLTPAQSAPLWFDVGRSPAHAAAAGRSRHDVVVVGGGIAGLLTALALAEAGRDVALLEARRIGDGTTGHTTGKVSLLQGSKLSRVLATNPPASATGYVAAGRHGQAWLHEYCAAHDIDHERAPATSYATTTYGQVRARAEHVAARKAGLPVEWTDDLDLPFGVRGAVWLDDQLQLHPGQLLTSLTADVEAAGAAVFEGSRVLGVERTRTGVEVRTSAAVLEAGVVVLATNQPILDRGGFFARLQPQRSYAAALVSSWVPREMHLSVDRESRSLRSARRVDGTEMLLLGGGGHVTGRSDPSRRLGQLLAWAREYFAGAQLDSVWSAQDQSPVTALPYVGPILPGEHRIHVMTGFDKWGLSTAPAAAQVVAADVLGRTPPGWAPALRSWTPREVLGAGRAALFNAEVAVQMACGHATRPLRADEPPLCPHLGGVLAWNSTEESWDCPLHGSRFTADGAVLEGPATRGL